MIRGQPVSVDEEEEGQESMNGGFGNDVCIQAVAKINRINIVTVCAPSVSWRHRQTEEILRDRGMETARVRKDGRKDHHTIQDLLYMMVKKDLEEQVHCVYNDSEEV